MAIVHEQHLDMVRSMEEDKIEQYARLTLPTISVVGLGGAGCNIVSWIKERGIVGGQLLALNTDASHLSITKADRRMLIGEKICRGMGCGGYVKKGERALDENLQDILKDLESSRIVFLTAGLGGGTGTGGICRLAEALKSGGEKLIVGVVTLPFEIERVRRKTAREAIEKLTHNCDTVVAIDNTKLVKVAGNLPFKQALGVANELIGVFVKDITETIATASLINLDFLDLRAIMEKRGLACIGVGFGDGDDRVEIAVKNALESQLLDVDDVTKAYGVLIHVSGGEDMTLEEVTKAGDLVTRYLSPEARIVWGARVNPNLGGRAHVMVILTGVESLIQKEGKTRFDRLKRIRRS
ncbi:MAG: cell division protein FtsZ [Candidatus Bathyarchaeia archaeon]